MPRVRLDVVTAAVKLLAARERTERTLRAALMARGFAEEEIAQALVRVRALGYLDEARFAALQVRAGLREGRSRSELRRRLEEAGVAPGLAAEVVERELGLAGYDELAAAQALLRRRRAAGARGARLLAARGFDEDLIGRLIPAVDGAPEDG